MAGESEKDLLKAEAIKVLKHDIKNQLSNIQLALDGLKYETADREAELKLYIDSIAKSAVRIDQLLNSFK